VRNGLSVGGDESFSIAVEFVIPLRKITVAMIDGFKNRLF